MRGAFEHFGRLLLRAAEVQHAVARRRCWRASSSKAKSACALAYAQGKGVLFVTGHFGFWELQAMVHALRLAADGGAGARARQPRAQRRCSSDIRTAHRQHA